MNVLLNLKVIFRDVPTTATKWQLNICQSISCCSKKQQIFQQKLSATGLLEHA